MLKASDKQVTYGNKRPIRPFATPRHTPSYRSTKLTNDSQLTVGQHRFSPALSCFRFTAELPWPPFQHPPQPDHTEDSAGAAGKI